MTALPAAPPVLAVYRAWIPGVPVAQGRGRAVKTKDGGVRVIDPPRSRSWKGAAQMHMLAARGNQPPLDGPLEVEIIAYWPRPRSLPKKAGTHWRWRPSRPDCDNVGKAVLDSGNSICWHDDAQIVRLVVEKRVCGAEDNCGVVVTARTLFADPARAAGGGA